VGKIEDRLLRKVPRLLPARLRYWVLIFEGDRHLRDDEDARDVPFLTVLSRSGGARDRVDLGALVAEASTRHVAYPRRKGGTTEGEHDRPRPGPHDLGSRGVSSAGFDGAELPAATPRVPPRLEPP
jgi:hypothetical protein